jgi:hypothetical protein
LLRVIKQAPALQLSGLPLFQEFPYYRTRLDKKSRFNFTEPHDYLKKFRQSRQPALLPAPAMLSGFGAAGRRQTPPGKSFYRPAVNILLKNSPDTRK